MNKDIYQIQSIGEDSLYVFASEGTLGKVKKVVLIRPVSDEFDNYFHPLFNLAFGDLAVFEGHWRLDDSARTGNGDMAKVIATVAAIAMDFLSKHPNSSLSFQGYIDQKSVLLGKNQRNILYQRAIDSNWEQLSDKLGFWGVKVGKLENYTPGNTYDRILVKAQINV